MSKRTAVREALDQLRKAHGVGPAELIAILKGGGSSSKGSSFEREFAEQLGLWWCRRDDAFWRSSGSGGRATGRRKQGKQTAGHSGDVAATDMEGQPLMRAITFELKRGYNDATPYDMFDVPETHVTPQPWEAFIAQAQEAAQGAGSLTWALVTRRDMRRAAITMDAATLQALAKIAGAPPPTPITRVAVPHGAYLTILLADFFATIKRQHIEEWARRNAD